MAQYDVSLAAARNVTPVIREMVLTSKDGAALPAYGPGAHIEITVRLADGKESSHPYSLLGGTATGDDPPDTYRIAVERRVDGAGGSAYLCDLPLGASVGISAPRNDFPLETHPANRLLIAGGIGIVPIFAMARRLKREGRAFTLAYVGRDADQMAYRDEIAAVAGGKVIVHEESREAAPLDVKPLAAKLAYPAEVYVCGSYALNRAVVAAASAAGLSRMQIHEQCFAPPPVFRPENNPFTVKLTRSDRTFEVPAEASILETMLTSGFTPKFYCGRGECGICPMTVVSADGAIEHRDHVLKPNERAISSEGGRFCICVSRLKSGTIVLDG
jgi:ferredoxin-NADP reductase